MTGSKQIWHALVRHRAVLLGAVLISLVWMAVFFFLKNEHDSAERAAIQNSTNLAGAFEEHLSRSLNEIDRSLKIIRTLYGRDPGKFDLVDWLEANRVLTDEVLQIAIVDRDGNVKLATSRNDRSVLPDYRASDHYKAHVDVTKDHLVIGKPTIDGPTGQWVLQLSRRIDDNSSFNGVIVAALDPTYLTRIYNSVSIGKNGYIRVIGRDGGVRHERTDIFCPRQGFFRRGFAQKSFCDGGRMVLHGQPSQRPSSTAHSLQIRQGLSPYHHRRPRDGRDFFAA